MLILDQFHRHVQTDDDNYKNPVWLQDHVAGEHALLCSCRARISMILLHFLQTLLIFLFLGHATLVPYEEHVPAKL
jgi:hypothetical protein